MSEDEERCEGTKNNGGKDKSEDTGASLHDLEKKTIRFIKPWVDKWKKQSIYQILLFCRSKQQRELVYFCQQVHLYNQNNRSILENIKEEVDLIELDLDADPKAIIPTAKISIHKTQFKLQDVIFVDNSHLLTPVINVRSQNTIDESVDEEWDSPLKPFFTNSPAISPNRNICDKECQTEIQEVEQDTTRNDSAARDEVNNSLANGNETNNNTNYKSEEPSEIQNKQIKSSELTQRRKPPKYIGVELKGNPHFGDTTVRKNQGINKQNRNAKQDGDALEELPKYNTPITELEEKFKSETREQVNDEDDPPYNFRSMLRKTNYSDPLYQKRTERTTSTFDFTLKKTKRTEASEKKRQITCINLTPNLIIEGEITDL